MDKGVTLATLPRILLKVPRALLLLLKTNGELEGGSGSWKCHLIKLLPCTDCLRAVDIALGQPVNTFIITARACSRALAENRVEAATGGRAKLVGRQVVGTSTEALLGVCVPGSDLGGRHAATSLSMMLRLLPVRLANALEAVRVEARIAMLEALAMLAAWGQPKRIAKSMV